MTENMEQSFHNPSTIYPEGDSDAVEAPVFWTFDDVQAALVEAHDLWRRTPRVGHRPLKSCWPNEMLQRIEGGDHDARGGDMVAPEPRPMPLSRAEVATRDVTSEWLNFVPDAVNRRIVILATAQLASGYTQVSWRKVQHDLRDQAVGRGRGICSERYNAAIHAITCALNNPEALAMIREGARPKAIAEACGIGVAEAYGMVRRLRGV